MYPDRQKYGIYPVGKPIQIRNNFKDSSEYFGIIKCTILPPFDLHIPVIPVHCNNKLVFPLCRTCAELQSKLQCVHDEDARALTGTWCSVEIEKAVEKGYIVLKIYEVFHWENNTIHIPNRPDLNDPSKELFVSYINQAVQEKTEASGYPENCNTDSEKDAYIERFFKTEGKLDKNINLNK